MANIELDGTNKKIKVDSGDLTLDVPGDIILDADGADLTFADGGTNILKVTNSSSDVVFQNQVDAKDIIFKQYDGTEVAKIDDDGSFKVANSTLSISQSSSDVIIKPLTDAKDIFFQQYDGRTLLDINDGGYVAIANGATGPGQLRLYEDTDNGTNYTALQVGTQSGDITYTLPTADGSNGQFLSTDGSGTLSWGTVSSGVALDDVSTGDAASTLATSAGDITIDAQGNDTDIIFKGTDGGADTTFLTIDGSAAGASAFNSYITSTAIYGKGDDNTGIQFDGSDVLSIHTGGTEGMRLHSAGLSIGTTETAYANLTQHSDNGIILTDTSSSIFATNQGANLVLARTNNDTNNRDIIIFNRQGSTQGEISGGNNNVNYGSNSDYRLKENVTYTWDATTRLKQLKPARFNFIADETNTLRDGFIAHEVSSIVPEAISGEKDGMAVETMYTADDVETQGDNPSKKVGDTKTYSSSEIKAQTIDASKLVPLLVKTIQELEVRIKTLEDA